MKCQLKFTRETQEYWCSCRRWKLKNSYNETEDRLKYIDYVLDEFEKHEQIAKEWK